MKEKIVKMLVELSADYWDNCSETETPKMSNEEEKFCKEQNEKFAEDIIKLFKNK